MCRAVFSAALKRLSRFAFLARFRSFRQTSADACHTASSTSRTHSQDAQPSIQSLQLAIHRRAIRLHNRDVQKAAEYVRVHETMMGKGRCYD